MTQIHPLSALKDNYIWAIINAQSKVIIVDPGEAEPVLAFLEQEKLRLQSILVTHHHWDHTQGIKQIIDTHPVPVFGSIDSKCPEVSHRLNDGDSIPKEHCFFDLQGLSIPGHTLDHMAFYGSGVLFSGDTLFSCGCGRIFEGTPAQMYASLEKLAELPDNTKLYCGHEYTVNNLRFAQQVDPNNIEITKHMEEVTRQRNQNLPSLPSTMALEKKMNPFLRCEQAAVRQGVETYSKKSLNTAIEVFTSLRKWKDNF